MKNEKAIEILDGSICRNSNYCNNDCQYCDVKEALDIGKVAIKKNIPQDVKYLPCWTGEVRYDEAECPSCGQQFEEYEDGWLANYCIKCGQALKWNTQIHDFILRQNKDCQRLQTLVQEAEYQREPGSNARILTDNRALK